MSSPFSLKRNRMITRCLYSIQQWKAERTETVTFWRIAALSRRGLRFTALARGRHTALAV
jgi:hypothetical protein